MPSTDHTRLVAALHHAQAEPGVVVKTARNALGLTQAELGRRCGYSASQVSRWENGKPPLRDVTLLRSLAEALSLPPTVFGLDDADRRASRSLALPRNRVRPATIPEAEEDPVRRRAFLHLAAIGGSALAGSTTAAAAPEITDPAQVLAARLGDVLLRSPHPGDRRSAGAMAEGLERARREFAACRYLPLAERLPNLISATEAAATEYPAPETQRMLAGAHILATRALIKLEASGLEWLAADRALHAARASEHPMTLAEARRLVASVARRAGHHDHAQALTLAAAQDLDIGGRRAAAENLDMYATLHMSAAYAAARAGDRERSRELLAEAETAASRLVGDSARHRCVVANLVSHRVSAAYELGDAGEALAHARSLRIAAVPTTERRARLLVDTARAWARWDKPDRAYRTLLTAERTAPGEVRTRNAVRRLVADLLVAPRQSAMPGLPMLAQRVHAAR